MKTQKKAAKKASIKDLPAGKKAKGVKGGSIGSATSGAGAGKIKFNT